MIYKTLIVLDTNRSRHGNYDGTIKYSEFVLGGEYESILKIVKENGLSNYVFIAIPRMVVEELLCQKIKSFENDKVNYYKIKNRLSAVLGGVPDVDVAGFDVSKYLNESLEQYLIDNSEVLILDIEEDEKVSVFDDIVKRAANKYKPFKDSGKSTDAGFKDVLIWETILQSKTVDNFNKILFLTGDSAFSDCKHELKRKRGEECEIVGAIADIESELMGVYGNVIERNLFKQYVDSDEFKNRLTDEITNLGVISTENGNIEFSTFVLQEICVNLEKNEDDEHVSYGVESRMVAKADTDIECKVISVIGETEKVKEIREIVIKKYD